LSKEVKSQEAQDDFKPNINSLDSDVVSVLNRQHQGVVEVDDQGQLPQDERNEVLLNCVLEGQRVLEIDQILDYF
jgi:hypothetical protein